MGLGLGGGGGGGVGGVGASLGMKIPNTGSLGGNTLDSRSSLPPVRGPSTAPSSNAPQTPQQPIQTPIISSTSPSTLSAASSSTHQIPPLPTNVQLNPSVTQVTVVPLISSVSQIPPLELKEIKSVQEWMAVDKEYEGRYRNMKERMAEELREVMSPRKAGWWERESMDVCGPINGPGRRRPREGFDVKYPKSRKDGRDKRKTGRREGLRL
jgi:SWI/SNF-related matrix-associated actin-dependent regulator of chromatin subfamily B member 1